MMEKTNCDKKSSCGKGCANHVRYIVPECGCNENAERVSRPVGDDTECSDRLDRLERRMGGIEKSIDELKSLIAKCGGCPVEPASEEGLGEAYPTDSRMGCVEEIMDNFDFERVAEVMRHLGWTWIEDGRSGVPNIDMIRENARRLLLSAWDAIDNKAKPDGDGLLEWEVSTGGFTAWVAERDGFPHECRAKLTFNVDEWSAGSRG